MAFQVTLLLTEPLKISNHSREEACTANATLAETEAVQNY
ncbi:hypothetical protein V202x_29550 [Gimesia aquarii]|uniref:Uncharacterized protein n=1 Tax=Gimesia aquarii TaxID=2527964 RepID=A0A517WWD6_9PLAN|nr:hypothetical protein V202x_29550 [Gimesia aquarii]